jgi:hypothetical protein
MALPSSAVAWVDGADAAAIFLNKFFNGKPERHFIDSRSLDMPANA